jgi:hypothetical protein
LVSQYVSAFSGKGGAERAVEKLDTMVKNEQLLVSEQKAANRRMVRVYSLPHATYAIPLDNGGRVVNVVPAIMSNRDEREHQHQLSGIA